MSIMIFQPKTTTTEHKDGTVLVKAPHGLGSGVYGPNYKLDAYPNAVPGVATGIINSTYSGRFDDYTYYTA